MHIPPQFQRNPIVKQAAPGFDDALRNAIVLLRNSPAAEDTTLSAALLLWIWCVDPDPKFLALNKKMKSKVLPAELHNAYLGFGRIKGQKCVEVVQEIIFHLEAALPPPPRR